MEKMLQKRIRNMNDTGFLFRYFISRKYDHKTYNFFKKQTEHD